jgi:hypothetical protein
LSEHHFHSSNIFNYGKLLKYVVRELNVLCGRFGYALANGTVGVYEKTTRWWRIKVVQ